MKIGDQVLVEAVVREIDGDRLLVQLHDARLHSKTSAYVRVETTHRRVHPAQVRRRIELLSDAPDRTPFNAVTAGLLELALQSLLGAQSEFELKAVEGKLHIRSNRAVQDDEVRRLIDYLMSYRCHYASHVEVSEVEGVRASVNFMPFPTF